MRTSRPRPYLILPVAVAVLALWAPAAGATHAWVDYHWARKANPFTLQLGDNVSRVWEPYLATASSDWSASAVLDTTVVPGTSRVRRCPPRTGRVEVCNTAYGVNGWLGLAQVSLKGRHITAGTVQLNDSYFTTTTYDTPAWRNLVMCQEVGHTLGLDHQDEDNFNVPLGSCMDYSADPELNQHPDAHDLAQLEAIYAHRDSSTTVAAAAGATSAAASQARDERWGRIVRLDRGGRPSVFVRDLGRDETIVTFVTWAG